MNFNTFTEMCEQVYNRCMAKLEEKSHEYSEGQDRLDQFYKTGAMNNEPPTKSAWGMASKHVTSIADMVKHPDAYAIEHWYEKLTDLHNYLYLIEAIVREDASEVPQVIGGITK